MTETKQPREATAKKPAARTASETELNEQELQKISGGKGCASGEHIKEGTITVRP
jgi:bacteriocin-like protein